ncbi:hypothetical protein Tco_0598271 [Tanacetum coccineum]
MTNGCINDTAMLPAWLGIQRGLGSQTKGSKQSHINSFISRDIAKVQCKGSNIKVPYGNETLTFRGNKSNDGRESRLTIISCLKAQEYMAKGCQIFLAHISAKKEEDKSEGKQLKDIPVVQDFPEVFPKDLPGLPPARPVEF